MSHDSDPIFREEQRFNQPWTLALIAASTLLAAVAPCVALWFDGSSAMEIALTGVAFVVVGGLLILLVRSTVMVTVVSGDGISVRIRPVPLAKWRIPLRGLESHRTEEFSAWREIRGWGVVTSALGRKRSYAMSGNRCVRLVYDDGKEIVLGSQRADELDRAITRSLRGGLS